MGDTGTAKTPAGTDEVVPVGPEAVGSWLEPTVSTGPMRYTEPALMLET